jgi:hypothetical protein
MSVLPSERAGFLPGSPSQCAGRRRRAAFAQLLTSGALLTCLVVALTAVLTNMAGAAPAHVHGGTGIAVAAFVVVVCAGVGGLVAVAIFGRRANRV